MRTQHPRVQLRPQLGSVIYSRFFIPSALALNPAGKSAPIPATHGGGLLLLTERSSSWQCLVEETRSRFVRDVKVVWHKHNYLWHGEVDF